MTERVIQCGTLKGHKGWVTSIATPSDPEADFIVSGSRDKTAIIWEIKENSVNIGHAKKSLRGHNHFIQDVVLSTDGEFALTASWDRTLRLWRLKNGETTKTFIGHENDVLGVSFSPDNRQIVSSSRDKVICVWNTLGECKIKLTENNHTNWISCVKFSPNSEKPIIISAGWDKLVKVWELNNSAVKFDLKGHTGYVNTIDISPDGSICASAGKDGNIMLWDLTGGKYLFSLNAGNIVNALAFSPNRFWLCAAVGNCIKIFDLQTTSIVDELIPDEATEGRKFVSECLSISWSANGNLLFSGYTDNNIRVWKVIPTQFGN